MVCGKVIRLAGSEAAEVNPAMFDRPFFEVTLLIVATIIAGIGTMISINHRRLEDMMKSLSAWTELSLDRIDETLPDHGTRIVKLGERAWQ